MENSGEPSSPISCTSSSLFSYDSTSYKIDPSFGSETRSSPGIISLAKLSNNLEQLLVDSSCDYSDAEIIVESVSVRVHRCILASRSRFFNEHFKKDKNSVEKEGKAKYCMSDLLPYGRVGREAFMVFLSYLYRARLRPSPPEVSTCVDNACLHDACRPAIKFAVELMYTASIFQVPELVSIFQRRLLNFADKALVEDVIPILVVAFDCQSNQLLTRCIQRVARSDLDSISLEKELPSEVSDNIKLLRSKTQEDDENNVVAVDPLREKGIRRIHKALDSDDVELVQLLLKESDITLDEANALHYAVAYCDPKVISEVLSMGLANVNLRNARGYTVLHIAAMQKEPSVILSLLTKGARASELALDGQSSVTICRRLTTPRDYHAKTKQCQEANKDRICIDILEREMRRNPMAVDTSVSYSTMTDNLHTKLLDLENRVELAQLLFPTEAKLAMDIAHTEITSKFAGLMASKGSSGNLREVDLNETPTMQQKRLFTKLEALSKTVEMGRHYFPHCSDVLDRFMEDDLPEFFYLEKGTPEEQKIKRMRFMELEEDVQKAFNKDKAKLKRSGLPSSSSLASLRERTLQN